MEAINEIQRRVSQLDTAPLDRLHLGSATSLDQVVGVMARVTNGYIAGTYGTAPVAKPEDVDAVVGRSSLLRRLGQMVLPLMAGPLAQEAQDWTIATDMLHVVPARHRRAQLAKEHFIPVSARTGPPATKPMDAGLFTSTNLPDVGCSMWVLYLSSWGGSLFPKPWSTSRVAFEDRVRIFEVTSAVCWAELVTEYLAEANGLLYPDWPRIAEHYDGIHMTVPAIVAMQGLRLRTPAGVTAETYWDIESTFWLNWCFKSVQPVGSAKR